MVCKFNSANSELNLMQFLISLAHLPPMICLGLSFFVLVWNDFGDCGHSFVRLICHTWTFTEQSLLKSTSKQRGSTTHAGRAQNIGEISIHWTSIHSLFSSPAWTPGILVSVSFLLPPPPVFPNHGAQKLNGVLFFFFSSCLLSSLLIPVARVVHL